MSEKMTIPAARHEARDVSERLIWITVAATAGLLITCGMLTLWLYPDSQLDRSLHLPLPQYPKPRLQADPTADMRAFYSREMDRLEHGATQDEGAAREPIDEAMRQVAAAGIEGWPKEPLPP